MLQSKSQNAIGQKDNFAEPISISTLLHQFSSPPPEYGPIDCWWWEAGHLDKERMRWQLKEMKEKGVAGTWFYPRFVYGQPLSSDPHYWTEEWWDFTKFSIEEHQRLGMYAWFNDWTAHQFFQNRVRQERENNPALTGRRLVIHEEEAKAPGLIKIDIPPEEEILYAAAYKKVNGSLDYASAKALSDAIADNKLKWEAKEAGWLVTVVTNQPHDLDYLNRVVVDRWLEIFLGVYEQKLPDFVGKTLKAYGTDEVYVLNGNILYSSSLFDRFKAEKGYDPSPYLVGLFHDIGKLTDKIRCEYYEVMVSMLEENLYKPFSQWLNERGMLFTEFCPNGKGEDMLVQTYHYGDFSDICATIINHNVRKITVWIDGQPAKVKEGRITLESPMEGVSQIALRVEQKPGCYAGAAFSLPVAFECEEGKIPLGDWCDYSLETYSGGAVYTNMVQLEKRHLEGKVLLDLGQVSTTAEVHVNGKPAGVKMAKPFCFDITQLVKEGENQIQVKVVNTLANHMSTYPTNYVYEGQTVSGLLGPVKIQFLSKVTLTAAPTSG